MFFLFYVMHTKSFALSFKLTSKHQIKHFERQWLIEQTLQATNIKKFAY